MLKDHPQKTVTIWGIFELFCDMDPEDCSTAIRGLKDKKLIETDLDESSLKSFDCTITVTP